MCVYGFSISRPRVPYPKGFRLFQELGCPGTFLRMIRRTFVGKVMSLLFNMLSRLVIAFLLRSKYLLIAGLQSLSTCILTEYISKIMSSLVVDS